jgi:hypothetical protein
MLNETEFVVLSADDADRLPDQELRRSFCTIIKELTAVWGSWTGPANDISVIAEHRDPDSVPTEEMRRIVAENQYWFNVPEIRA